MIVAFVQNISFPSHHISSSNTCEGQTCKWPRTTTSNSFKHGNKLFPLSLSMSHSPNGQNMVNVPQARQSKRGRRTKQEQNSERHMNESVSVIRRSGMNAAVVLSDELRTFLGADMMLRRDVIAAISSYAHNHNLTCPHDKRKFRMDDTLKRIFKTDEEQQYLLINKLVKPFIRTPVEAGPSYENRAQEMFYQYIQSRGAVNCSDERVKKEQLGQRPNSSKVRARRRGDGIFRPVHVDEELLMICGGKQVMSRPEVLRRIWQYIKSHNLQDPSNGRRIRVNDTLRKALGLEENVVDSFHLGKYVARKVRAHATPNQ